MFFGIGIVMKYKHKYDIAILCWFIVMSGLTANSECITIARSRAMEVTGWTDHVNPERDHSVCLALGMSRLINLQ